MFDAKAEIPAVCLPQTCPSVRRRLMESRTLPECTYVCVMTTYGHQGLTDHSTVCVCGGERVKIINSERVRYKMNSKYACYCIKTCMKEI